MEIRLKDYSDQHKEQTIEWIAHFFGFHTALDRKGYILTKKNFDTAAETLQEWLSLSGRVYIIVKDAQPVGFLRLSYRGANVAWIEDIFVVPEHRNQGIATQAIQLAEVIVKETPGYTAICMDVAPRNIAALRLYNKLGYDNLSIVTVRKEINGRKYDRKTSIEGIEFNY